jgi:Kef-type K+ transport system membrane component KefB
MSAIIIISICVLLLFAYVFDITSSKTKIPSAILLLLLGWCVKQIISIFETSIPDLSSVLPGIGTIGLILIVLEGSLELEFNKSKLAIIGKSSLIAFLSVLLLSFGLALAFYLFEDSTFKISLTNAIPITVISSAIAIPSAKNLLTRNKEFVTYESSLSDIFGVIFFNFIVLNNTIGSETFGIFSLQLLILILISFISALALAYLLSKIKHHVKFAPIILLIILIYLNHHDIPGKKELKTD